MLAATYTPYPTYTRQPTYTLPPTVPATPEPTQTVEATVTIEPTETPQVPTAIPTTVTKVQPGLASPTLSSNHASAGQAVVLTRIADTDPGSPITILVSAIRIQGNGLYKLTGTVRNDGTEIYGGIGVVATFFTELECGEHYIQQGGRKGQPDPGSGTLEYGCDPNWYGPVEVYAACQLLAPGGECPFSLDIYTRDYVAYHLHPEGAPVAYSQPASLALSDLHVTNGGFGYVQIKGAATNTNPFTVRDAFIYGTLMDAAGQITSVGTTIVPGEIAPGANVAFDNRIE